MVVEQAVSVALAHPKDAAGIAQVHVASWQAAYRGIFPDAYLDALSTEQREQWWRRAIDEQPRSVLVARQSERIVGFVNFGPYRRTMPPEWAHRTWGEVWALYVSPQAWSQSVGRALWDEARDRLMGDGMKDIALWVLSENARAIRFYEQLGFCWAQQVRSQVTVAKTVRSEALYILAQT